MDVASKTRIVFRVTGLKLKYSAMLVPFLILTTPNITPRQTIVVAKVDTARNNPLDTSLIISELFDNGSGMVVTTKMTVTSTSINKNTMPIMSPNPTVDQGPQAGLLNLSPDSNIHTHSVKQYSTSTEGIE